MRLLRKIKVLALILLSFSVQNSKAQNQKIADSLIVELCQLNELDSVYLDLLKNIALNHTTPDSSIKYGQKLIQSALLASNNYYLYEGHLAVGSSFRIKGILDSALIHFYKSIENARLVDYNIGVAKNYCAIADAYSLSDNRTMSLKFYHKSMVIFREQKDTIRLAASLLNAGSEYMDVNSDTAFLLLNEASLLFEKQNYTIGQAYSLGNLGILYVEKSELERAKEYLLRAISILKPLNDFYSISAYQNQLSIIYKKEGKICEAINMAQNCIELAKNNNIIPQLKDGHKTLSELYEIEGNYKEAFYHQTRFLNYRDSLKAEESIRKMADLRTNYEVAKKQAEIELITRKRRFEQILIATIGVVAILIGFITIIIYRDRTKVRELNTMLSEQTEELKSQSEQLKELNNTKDRFFSIISHDLRGPIGIIDALPPLYRNYLDKKDYQQIHELNEQMDKSVKSVSALLDNLLDWALSQQSQFPFQPENISVSAFLNEVLELFGPMAASKNIVLSVKTEGEIIIYADLRSLMTIMRNLIHNAIKFTSKDGNISLEAINNDELAYIKVIDDGIGIPDEKMNSIFKLYDKKSTWGTNKEKGLGIGLNLAYEFAKMNKGSISVESTVSKGTTFTIGIPLATN